MKQIDAWIFYSGYSYNLKMQDGYIPEIVERAKTKYNINLEVKDIHKFVIVSAEENKIYYDGELVTNFPQFAILRRYEIYLGRQLEKLGVKVFNNVQAMIDARNKMKTHQMLAEANVSTPKTVYIVPKKCLKNVLYTDAVKYMGNEKFVVKWLYGSQGAHVYLVDNEKDFNDLLIKYEGKIICQEFIEDSYGQDIRAYVVGGKYIGAAIRKSSGGFRSNLAQGGEAIDFTNDDDIKEIALAAAKAVNLDICGIDILIGKDKYYVCEVNALPGFKSIGKTKGIDEKDIFLEFIYDKMNSGD